MSELRDPLKCGECGSDTFKLVNVRPEDEHRVGGGGGSGAIHRPRKIEKEHGPPSDVAGYILVVCENDHESVISVSVPSVTIQGNLCGGWS